MKMLMVLYCFLCASMSAVTQLQLKQQVIKRAFYQAVGASNTLQVEDVFTNGMNTNMGLTELAFAFDNAQQRTGKDLSSVTLNYGMTAFDYLPMIDSLSVIVSANLYAASDLPPFLVPDCTLFSSIQKALDYLETATTTTTDVSTVYVCAGNYDEDLLVPAFKALYFYVLGNVSLGSSTHARSVVWEVDNETEETQIMHVGTLTLNNLQGQLMCYPGAWNIFGDFFIENNDVTISGLAYKHLTLQAVTVDGVVGYSGSKNIGTTYIYLDNCVWQYQVQVDYFAHLLLFVRAISMLY